MFYGTGTVNKHLCICVAYNVIPTMFLSRACTGCMYPLRIAVKGTFE